MTITMTIMGLMTVAMAAGAYLLLRNASGLVESYSPELRHLLRFRSNLSKQELHAALERFSASNSGYQRLEGDFGRTIVFSTRSGFLFPIYLIPLDDGKLGLAIGILSKLLHLPRLMVRRHSAFARNVFDFLKEEGALISDAQGSRSAADSDEFDDAAAVNNAGGLPTEFAASDGMEAHETLEAPSMDEAECEDETELVKDCDQPRRRLYAQTVAPMKSVAPAAKANAASVAAEDEELDGGEVDFDPFQAFEGEREMELGDHTETVMADDQILTKRTAPVQSLRSPRSLQVASQLQRIKKSA